MSAAGWWDDAADLEVAVPVATVWSSPDAPRDQDAPAVADRPDLVAWTSGLDAAGRLGLAGRTLTQGLLGEPVRIRAERPGWVEVRLPWQRSGRDPDGYPGWMRRSHLAEPVRPAGAAVSVLAPTARLSTDPGTTTPVSFGTVLRRDGQAPGDVAVLLPGGRRGRVPEGATTRPGRPVEPLEVGRVLQTARTFLGLRYLWGGLSAWGLDCSGLVHLTLRGLGRLVPRDARDQASYEGLTTVDPGAVRPGDLWFFSRDDRVTHVGFVSDRTAPDGNPLMLHAPERDGGGLVEEAPLDGRRRATLLGAGRLGLTGACG